MKFDIDKVKQGAGVFTLDGHGARIVCTNLHTVGGTLSDYPIVGVVYNAKGEEEVHRYNLDGVPMDMPTDPNKRLLCSCEVTKWALVECCSGIFFMKKDALYDKKEDAVCEMRVMSSIRDLRVGKVTFNFEREVWT